ncbi:putative outer membrane protein [Helicobacter cetorum]|uniref:Putative outer membrane protein n=1 Tax=Helicobacter cetorum (strain ATCC BAA-540 / CCUG 52418 / MIT 99-5656) TaxID=1163745 RepID=I0EQM8_HELCM|nr:putative outer membrane protein [Helicobacter cetorum]AFI05247.1 putative outer membrane protein [Helicobacter cetorum MIT 99-5656]
MKKTFISLYLVNFIAPIEVFSHPKDGFFIEAGFETGLLQTKERLIQKPNNPFDSNAHRLNGIGKNEKKQENNKEKPIKATQTNTQKNEKQGNENTETIIDVPKDSVIIDEAPTKNNPNGESIIEVPSNDGKIKTNTKIDIDGKEMQAEKIAPNVVEVNGGDMTQNDVPNDSPTQSASEGASKDTYPTLNNSNSNTLNHTSHFTSPDLSQKTTQLLTDSNVTDYYNAFTTLRPIKTMLLDKSAKTNLPQETTWSTNANSLDNTTALNKDNLVNQDIVIQNFLPYDVNNVVLVIQAKDNQGNIKEIPLANFDSISKNTEIKIDASMLKNLEHLNGSVDIYDFKFKTTTNSNEETKRIFTALEGIKTNIQGRFNDDPMVYGYQRYCGDNCYTKINQTSAQHYVNALLNMAYVIDSPEWKNAIDNATFSFIHRGHLVEHQEVVDSFRKDSNFFRFKALRNDTETTTLWGLATPTMLSVTEKVLDPTYTSIHVDPKLAHNDPYASYGTLSERFKFHVLLHEYSHTKGYFGHSASMTGYGANSFAGISTNVWTALNESNKLPIDYKGLQARGERIGKYGAIQNQFALLSTLDTNLNQFMSAISSFSNRNNPIQNQTYSNVMLGFNAKMGYQKYLNNYVGFAYYTIIKYNYSKSSGYAGVIQQVGAGGGIDLLLDFHTKFSGKSIKSTLGVFGGLRGLYNGYSLLKNVFNTGNLDVVSGLNYRYKKSKYSVGIAIPLVQQNLKLSLNDSVGVKEITLKEGSSHFKVFFNYGWVF